MAFPFGITDPLIGTALVIVAAIVLGVIGNAIAKFGIFLGLGIFGGYYVYDNTGNMLYAGATLLLTLLGGLMKI
jgi:hypothetical protein